MEQMKAATRTSRVTRMLPEILLALLVLGIATLLIAPLPASLLDLLLAANLGLAVSLLLVGLSVERPLSVTVFPSVLLMATLFRLGLNVSSTRLILGDAWAGSVIDAFASWVIGGSLVVGTVIFLILTVIQFVVIARGGERVAEVAARFALDAMPGRQMAIDADIRAGALTLDQARKARDDLQQESRLFGAMDGAMKFVKGDAIAGLVILAVDLLGGVAVGVLERDLGVAEALALYGRLTIGDGLVTQIPALLIAMSASLIVTRVAASRSDSAQSLGSDIVQQLLQHPRALAIAAVFLAALAVLPGLPPLPFLLLAGAVGGLALVARRSVGRELVTSVVQAPLAARLALQIPDEAQRDAVLEHVEQLRGRWGVPLPTPLVEVQPDSWAILLDGFVAASGDSETFETLGAELERLLPDILSMQDVRSLLDQWSEREPGLVSDAVPGRAGLFELTRLLRALLRDRLPIQPMRLVLEAVLEAPRESSVETLHQFARIALGMRVAEGLIQESRVVCTVGPSMTAMLRNARNSDGALRLGAAVTGEITRAIAHEAEESEIALAVPGEVRGALVEVLLGAGMRMPVVSFEALARAEASGVVVERGPMVDVGGSVTPP